MQIDVRRAYLEQGYLRVPDLWPPERVHRLRQVCEHCLCQWREGNPENGRAGIEEPGASSMRHLNHPGYFQRPGQRAWLTEILAAAADPEVLRLVREVLDDEVVFRCTSLFMNPLDAGGEGGWHRDSQFGTPDPAEERALIEREAAQTLTSGRVSHIQFQVALVPSDDVEYVPRSHLRVDSPEEHFIRLADGTAHARAPMPGAKRLHLQPGDTLALNAFGLHRGRYLGDRYRRTLMLTYTAAHADPVRDYFSRQPWFLTPGYLDGLTPEATAFYTRFIETYRDFWGAST